jgi:hypothetical protein
VAVRLLIAVVMAVSHDPRLEKPPITLQSSSAVAAEARKEKARPA